MMNIGTLQHNVRPEGALPQQEAEVFDLLETLGIAYDCVVSDAADTMEKCAAVSEVLGMPICKNLFLCNRQQTQFYLLVMAPDQVFHTKDLSRQIGSSRLSFAPEEKLLELLHCTPGSATALGLMHDTEQRVQFLMERKVAQQDCFSCHPCLCTATLKIKTADLLEKFLPHTAHTVTVVELPEE